MGKQVVARSGGSTGKIDRRLKVPIFALLIFANLILIPEPAHSQRDTSSLKEMLIWSGHLTVSDLFDPDQGIRKGLRSYRNGRSGPDHPSDSEWQDLERRAFNAREANGFAIKADPITKACIGIPEAVIDQRGRRGLGSMWTTQPKWIEIDIFKISSGSISDLLDKLRSYSQGGARRTVHKQWATFGESGGFALMEHSFAIFGQDVYPRGSTEMFYVSAHEVAGEILGLSVTWNKSRGTHAEMLAAGIANAFSPHADTCPPVPSASTQAAQAPIVRCNNPPTHPSGEACIIQHTPRLNRGGSARLVTYEFSNSCPMDVIVSAAENNGRVHRLSLAQNDRRSLTCELPADNQPCLSAWNAACPD